MKKTGTFINLKKYLNVFLIVLGKRHDNFKIFFKKDKINLDF